MSRGFRLLALSLLALPFAACGGYDPNEVGDTGSVESVEEAQTLGPVDIKRVVFTGVGESNVTCPSNYPRVFGTAHGVLNGALRAGGISVPLSEATGAVTRPHDPTTTTSATAVCSPDVNQSPFGAVDADGDVTASCPAGMVAAGGGGYCADRDAKLIRSRPNPDQHGSVPRGWRATCDKGTASATVNCWKPEQYESQCRTVRQDTANNRIGSVNCASDEHMIAAGAYCSGANAIRTTFIHENTSGMVANCTSATTVNAYGICCDNLRQR